MDSHSMLSSMARATLALSVVALMGACGDGGGGDDSGSDGAGTGGRTGGTGGTGGRTGGTGGGTGGVAAPMCGEPMQTTAIECGGTMCTIPPIFMGIDTCTRSCCVMDGADEVCGTRNVSAMATSDDCILPPKPDPRCPDYTDTTMAMREGCCNPDNVCGVISTVIGMCVTTSPLVPDLPATPLACDAGL